MKKLCLIELLLLIYNYINLCNNVLYEFKQARKPSTRTIYVILGGEVEFPCFVMRSSDQNYGKMAHLLENANWKNPRGAMLTPGSVESNRIFIDVLKTLRVCINVFIFFKLIIVR